MQSTHLLEILTKIYDDDYPPIQKLHAFTMDTKKLPLSVIRQWVTSHGKDFVADSILRLILDRWLTNVEDRLHNKHDDTSNSNNNNKSGADKTELQVLVNAIKAALAVADKKSDEDSPRALGAESDSNSNTSVNVTSRERRPSVVPLPVTPSSSDNSSNKTFTDSLSALAASRRLNAEAPKPPPPPPPPPPIFKVAPATKKKDKEHKRRHSIDGAQQPEFQSIVLRYPPGTIAEQMTLVHYSLFCEIDSTEFFNGGWSKKNAAQVSPRLLAYINRFNMISQWIQTQIVQTSNIETRADLIGRFIQMGKEFLRLHNFQDMMVVNAALNNAAISRLKASWALVQPTDMMTFNTIMMFFSPSFNYNTYRKKLMSCDPPVIPFLAVVCSDLTFIEESENTTPTREVRERIKQREAEEAERKARLEAAASAAAADGSGSESGGSVIENASGGSWIGASGSGIGAGGSGIGTGGSGIRGGGSGIVTEARGDLSEASDVDPSVASEHSNEEQEEEQEEEEQERLINFSKMDLLSKVIFLIRKFQSSHYPRLRTDPVLHYYFAQANTNPSQGLAEDLSGKSRLEWLTEEQVYQFSTIVEPKKQSGAAAAAAQARARKGFTLGRNNPKSHKESGQPKGSAANRTPSGMTASGSISTTATYGSSSSPNVRDTTGITPRSSTNDGSYEDKEKEKKKEKKELKKEKDKKDKDFEKEREKLSKKHKKHQRHNTLTGGRRKRTSEDISLSVIFNPLTLQMTTIEARHLPSQGSGLGSSPAGDAAVYDDLRSICGEQVSDLILTPSSGFNPQETTPEVSASGAVVIRPRYLLSSSASSPNLSERI
eukprot:TRINITY_DN1845_c0_g2_i5.p1 TRINITY_DN1845_c0_g2~~TRINITY_DN1845_c0_g2_i5.p1  ORF type:complete len:830 (+),score=177.60 TRINITY_DN1845_c0_g2_i5:734-3223(+)